METAEAIRNDNRLRGVSPKDDVSQERIWEEIKKAWSQSKDYRNYLQFFTKFDMWSEVFPNSDINTDLVDSKDFIVVMANLFKNESLSGLERKLVQEYKIETDTANKVCVLISLIDFRPEQVLDIYKKRQQSSTTDASIIEWIRLLGLSEMVKKFVDWKPSVSAQELMSTGLKGAELGQRIRELEIESFKRML